MGVHLTQALCFVYYICNESTSVGRVAVAQSFYILYETQQRETAEQRHLGSLLESQD